MGRFMRPELAQIEGRIPREASALAMTRGGSSLMVGDSPTLIPKLWTPTTLVTSRRGEQPRQAQVRREALEGVARCNSDQRKDALGARREDLLVKALREHGADRAFARAVVYRR